MTNASLPVLAAPSVSTTPLRGLSGAPLRLEYSSPRPVWRPLLPCLRLHAWRGGPSRLEDSSLPVLAHSSVLRTLLCLFGAFFPLDPARGMVWRPIHLDDPRCCLFWQPLPILTNLPGGLLFRPPSSRRPPSSCFGGTARLDDSSLRPVLDALRLEESSPRPGLAACSASPSPLSGLFCRPVGQGACKCLDQERIALRISYEGQY